jgi:multicomponent K+:H+ antiporter subunit G
MTLDHLFQALFLALLASGVFFALVGSLGLLKLSTFLRRLHGPTKASTLGVGSVLLAAMLHHAWVDSSLGLRELLITLFLFLSAPVSAMVIAKAAMATDASARPPAAPGSEQPAPVETAPKG